MTTPAPPDRAAVSTPGLDRRGLLLGAAAYIWWGALPLYLELVAPAQPLEIIAHRVVWSLLFCLLLLAITRTLGSFGRLLKTPRLLGTLAVAAVLVGLNWSVYVYGATTGHVLDAALGYFINPLVTVLLAVAVLHERLRVAQWIALGVGAGAVAVITMGINGFPWIAVILAFTFGFYGLVKNRVGRQVEPVPGLAVETLVLTPLATGYLIWLHASGSGTFTNHGVGHALLLAAAGIVTAVPLLLFAGAAQRLPLSVVGLLQYLAPVLQFLCGLLVFHEHMAPARWLGFGLVWLALVILTVDAVRAARLSLSPSRPSPAPASPSTAPPSHAPASPSTAPPSSTPPSCSK